MAAKAVGRSVAAVGSAGAAAEAAGTDGARCASGRKRPVRWSEPLAERLLARLADGEMLYRLCAEPGMPTPEGVAKWRKDRPDFAARLAAARKAGGRPEGSRGPVSTFCEGIAEEVFQRVCEGQALTRIGEDPTMPCVWTIFRWRRERPQFDQTVALAMRIRAERLCDEGLELSAAATPDTAYLTDVRLKHLRWTTGVMAPRAFRTRMAEPEAPQVVRTILFRHFKIEEDEETGKRRVVAYCPNPITGEVEREDTPGWRQAGDADTFSLPGGRGTGQGYRARDPG